MTIHRRALLLGGLAPLAACTTGSSGGSGRGLRLAGGEPGSVFQAFTHLLAQELSAAAKVDCTVRQTSGSLANAELLRTSAADLALMMGDAARVTRSGPAPVESPVASPVEMCALGRVYEDYLQLVVRADSPVRTVADLTGKVVSVGSVGSGVSLTGQRVLDAAQVRVQVRHYTLTDAATALAAGKTAALVWAGGVPTPVLATLATRVGIRMLRLDTLLPALRARYGPIYDQAMMPDGAYRGVPAVPTLGVADILMCRPDLPAHQAALVVRTLVRRADRMVPQEALGAQFLDIRSLIDTGEIPLHPGAADEYRRLHG